MPNWFTLGKPVVAVLTALAILITLATVKFIASAGWEKIVTEVSAQTTKELDARIGTVEVKISAVKGKVNELEIKVDNLAKAVKEQSTVQAQGYDKIIEAIENQR